MFRDAYAHMCACENAIDVAHEKETKKKNWEQNFLRYRFHSLLFCVGRVRLATGASCANRCFTCTRCRPGDCLHITFRYRMFYWRIVWCSVYSSRYSKQTRLASQWARKQTTKAKQVRWESIVSHTFTACCKEYILIRFAEETKSSANTQLFIEPKRTNNILARCNVCAIAATTATSIRNDRFCNLHAHFSLFSLYSIEFRLATQYIWKDADAIAENSNAQNVMSA